MSRKHHLMTTPERSDNMSRIRAKGNKTTELAAAGLLRKHHISGWRRHLDLPGRPDFAFPEPKVAVFVDGCFWHGCPRCYRDPVNNADYWRAKIAGNRRRDGRVRRSLRSLGWSVVRVWEHSLRDPDRVAKRIRKALDRRSGLGSGT